MALKVIGWAHYDDKFRSAECSKEELEAVAHELKSNGYKFGGDDHEEMENCAPVLSNGRMYRTSWRGWGGVMAYAYDIQKGNDYNYSIWYMGSYAPEERKFPPSREINFDGFFSGVTVKVEVGEREISALDDANVCKVFFPAPFDVCFGDKVQFVDGNGKVIATRKIKPQQRIWYSVDEMYQTEDYSVCDEKGNFGKVKDTTVYRNFTKDELEEFLVNRYPQQGRYKPYEKGDQLAVYTLIGEDD